MRLKSTSLLAEAPGVTDSRGYHATGGHGEETHMPVGIYRWRRKGNLRNLAQALKVSMACRNMHFHFSSPSLHLSLPFHPTCSHFSLFLQLLHAIPAHPSVPAVIILASSPSLDTPLPSKPQSSLQQSQPPLSASGSLAVPHCQLLHQNVHQPFLFLCCLVESLWVFCILKSNYFQFKSSKTLSSSKSFPGSFWETHYKE